MSRIKLSVLLFFFIILSTFSQEKKYTKYTALKGETVYSISKKFLITPNDLLQLNPDIRDGIAANQIIIVPNKNYKPELDSEKKGDYVKDGFIYHKVLPKENFYRLKKQFGVAKRILRKHNLVLRTGKLKAGQVIKIPVKEGYQIAATADIVSDVTKPYLVKPKETKYSIARRYGISIERLEELNPHIKEGLKLAEIIKVPDTREIPDIEEDFVLHQIEKGETLFSLGQKFNMSAEQLMELNPELKEGVKEGELIKILTESFMENVNVFIPSIPENKRLKIAFMLPFTGKNNNLDFKKNKTLDRVTDFYLGSLMALDSVKKLGLSVSVKVFDTRNNKATISNILRTETLSDIDALIGPMFIDNVEFISNSLKNDSLAIISPVSSKDHVLFSSKNVIKETPSGELLAKKVLEYVEQNYTDQHVIVIADDKKENESKINELVLHLNTLDSIQKVVVLKPEDGYIKPDLFKETILEKRENWIVLMTEDDVLTSDVVNNLGVLPKEINATLFAFHRKDNFDKAGNDFLARVNFHYPSVSFIDMEDFQIKKFIKKYKDINHAEPSEFAFKGFDITYDALLRLATHTDTESAFNSGVSERTSCKFQYVNTMGKGFENKGVFLIKYDGLNLKKVE